MLDNLKRKLKAGRGKAHRKYMEAMINALKYAGKSQDEILGMCKAVWKKEGYTKEQLKKAEDQLNEYFK